MKKEREEDEVIPRQTKEVAGSSSNIQKLRKVLNKQKMNDGQNILQPRYKADLREKPIFSSNLKSMVNDWKQMRKQIVTKE